MKVLGMSGDNNKQNHKENAIFASIITTVVLIVLIAVPVVMWVWSGTDELGDTRLDRSRIASPLLTAGIAIVTLLTVLWRGSIASRQAEEQKRQNDSKDDAEMALLLEKASDFVGSKDAQKFGVGLAMLETVALGPQEEYALFALDLVFDQIAISYEFPETVAVRNLRQIYRTFEQAREKRGRVLENRVLNLEKVKWERNGHLNSFTPNNNLPISSIYGARIITNKEELVDKFINNPEITCSNSEFVSRLPRRQILSISVSSGVRNKFVNFRIARLELEFLTGHHKFARCDVSGAEMEDFSIRHCEFDECTFDEYDPPDIYGEENGEKFLINDPTEIELNYPFTIKEKSKTPF